MAIDTHTKTDWQVSTNTSFTNIVLRAEGSTDLTSHIFANPALTNGTTYYARCRHYGQNFGTGGWSSTRSFKAISTTVTKSGRTVCRHPSNAGTVLEYKVGSATHSIIVLDASYRRIMKLVGDSSINPSALTDYSKNNINGNGFINGTSKFVSTIPTVTDATLDTVWTGTSRGADTNNSTFNTTQWYNYDSSTSYGAGYVRSIVIGNKKADVPCSGVLARILIEGSYIDSMDPTASSNIHMRIYNDGNPDHMISSTKTGANIVSIVTTRTNTYFSACDIGDKSLTRLIVPIIVLS